MQRFTDRMTINPNHKHLEIMKTYTHSNQPADTLFFKGGSGQQSSGPRIGTDDGISNRNMNILLIIFMILTMGLSVAFASQPADVQGRAAGIIKVSGDLDGGRFSTIGLQVKAMVGNLLAVDLPAAEVASLGSIRGVRSLVIDRSVPIGQRSDLSAIVRQYLGAGAVIGIIDNVTVLNAADISRLQKTDHENGIGFITYVSDDPSSTVIMRNLGSGESDLMRALAYMRDYARTVGRPLVVDMRLQEQAMNNPLFVQGCENLAAEGINFMSNGHGAQVKVRFARPQFSIALYDPVNSRISDRMPYWAMEELPGVEMMLAGSDGSACGFRFGEQGRGIHIDNRSGDLVLLEMIGTDGRLHSYHITDALTTLLPREVGNGTVMLEAGSGGVFPFRSKGNVVQGGTDIPVMHAIRPGSRQQTVKCGQDGGIRVSAVSGRRLILQWDGPRKGARLELTDRDGKVVYQNVPQESATVVETRIDLSQSSSDLYFLRVSSIDTEHTYAVLME